MCPPNPPASVTLYLISDYWVVLKGKKFPIQAALAFFRVQFKGRTPNFKDIIRGEATNPLREENLYHLGLAELGHRDAKKHARAR